MAKLRVHILMALMISNLTMVNGNWGSRSRKSRAVQVKDPTKTPAMIVGVEDKDRRVDIVILMKMVGGIYPDRRKMKAVRMKVVFRDRRDVGILPAVFRRKGDMLVNWM